VAKPGISRILLNLFSFDDAAFRCRPAKDIQSGPRNERGWLVGHSMAEALSDNCWEHSVLVGVTAKSGASQEGCGILGDPARVILEDDVAIFISRHSMPIVPTDVPIEKLISSYKHKMHSSKFGKARKVSPSGEETVKAILVCGWREEWSKDTKMLRGRIKSLGAQADEDVVHMKFLNLFSAEQFFDVMNKIRATADADTIGKYYLEGEEQGMVYKMELTHFQGDGVSEEDLAEVLDTDDFEVALVMATQVGLNIPPILRDSRVLKICMLLRYLTDQNRKSNKTIRICSENCLDQTSALAVTPQPLHKSAKHVLPDFINTPAIYARALTMALAYPEMGPAILAMSETDDNLEPGQLGEPQIEFIDTTTIGIVGMELSLNDLQEVFPDEDENCRTIVIGYSDKLGTIAIAPPAFECREWDLEDRVIMFQRKRKLKSQRKVINIGLQNRLDEANATVSLSRAKLAQHNQETGILKDELVQAEDLLAEIQEELQVVLYG